LNVHQAAACLASAADLCLASAADLWLAGAADLPPGLQQARGRACASLAPE
jgi:hypothetical protein